MKSVLASYTLSLAVFIPMGAWMTHRFGTGRVLQGCGGAMMGLVGRLTLVRTFAKSELIRAMSVVTIPV